MSINGFVRSMAYNDIPGMPIVSALFNGKIEVGPERLNVFTNQKVHHRNVYALDKSEIGSYTVTTTANRSNLDNASMKDLINPGSTIVTRVLQANLEAVDPLAVKWLHENARDDPVIDFGVGTGIDSSGPYLNITTRCNYWSDITRIGKEYKWVFSNL